MTVTYTSHGNNKWGIQAKGTSIEYVEKGRLGKGCGCMVALLIPILIAVVILLPQILK